MFSCFAVSFSLSLSALIRSLLIFSLFAQSTFRAAAEEENIKPQPPRTTVFAKWVMWNDNDDEYDNYWFNSVLVNVSFVAAIPIVWLVARCRVDVREIWANFKSAYGKIKSKRKPHAQNSNWKIIIIRIIQKGKLNREREMGMKFESSKEMNWMCNFFSSSPSFIIITLWNFVGCHRCRHRLCWPSIYSSAVLCQLV